MAVCVEGGWQDRERVGKMVELVGWEKEKERR